MTLRRLRIQYISYHIPPVWAAYYEPPGRVSCYCHASTIDVMWERLRDYFDGKGYCPPQITREGKQ